MIWWLFKWNCGIILSRLCKNAMALATSTASLSAKAVSTVTLAPSCSKVKSDPHGIYWLITTKLGGELQQPMTGNTLGCENILKKKNYILSNLIKIKKKNNYLINICIEKFKNF